MNRSAELQFGTVVAPASITPNRGSALRGAGSKSPHALPTEGVTIESE